MHRSARPCTLWSLSLNSSADNNLYETCFYLNEFIVIGRWWDINLTMGINLIMEINLTIGINLTFVK